MKLTHEQIALRAILLWKASGTPSDRDEEIWLEAERQLANEAKERVDSAPAATESSSSTPPTKETEITATAKIPSANRSGKRRSS